MDVNTILARQHEFFASGTTLPISFRIEQLKKWKSLINAHEVEIIAALKQDLHKATTESLLTEIIMVTDEIDFIIKNLQTWARPQKAKSPFPNCWPGRSLIHYEPYGSVLVIAPWNYPFLLALQPLIGAICAGNCVILKPSEIATHTQDLIYNLISKNFPSEYIAAIKAGPEEMPAILQEKFDYIFFTGGTQTGKAIMSAAAQHLTPVTLELGGKSPCIIDETADLDFTARRIIWGKFINAGQTCIAPDYLLVQQTQKDALVQKLIAVIKHFYGDTPETSSSYPRIINAKHFHRLARLMQNGKIIHGGKINEDDLFIEPTLIDDVKWDDAIMQEEIFGPLLPIITYDKLDDVIKLVNSRPKPLALYLFTCSKANENQVINHISFGGGCINDCLLQIANNHLPFGGVGSSGIGAYHGKYSFETFSHRKGVFKKTMRLDFRLEYPPYSANKLKWLRRLLSF